MSLPRFAALSALALLPLAVQAETFASATHSFIRGAVPGDDAGFYGGSFPGAFPVPLTDAAARAAVLGAPDANFVSLPGVPLGPSGSAFEGAYAEVSFGANFGADTELKLWELGNNQESAHLFLWMSGGGNIQFDVTRGASDVIAIDLSAYAPILGAQQFTKVGIGGLDRNGASQGFDLDAVSIAAVPEPSTYALMFAGLGAIGWLARRRGRTADTSR